MAFSFMAFPPGEAEETTPIAALPQRQLRTMLAPPRVYHYCVLAASGCFREISAATANVRFWPVTVTHQINLNGRSRPAAVGQRRCPNCPEAVARNASGSQAR
jgi:hypothetical protein